MDTESFDVLSSISPLDGPLGVASEFSLSSVTVLVGPHGTPFTLSAAVLSSSDYFRAALSERWRHRTSNVGGLSQAQPIRVDCEEDVFRILVRLMQYGSFSAIPANLPPDLLFRVEHDMGFLGISVADSPSQSFASSPSVVVEEEPLVTVSWQSTNYKDILCHCVLRHPEAHWVVSLSHCYVFCARCANFVSLPEDLYLKVMMVAQGPKRQSRMLPEAGFQDRYRGGALAFLGERQGVVAVRSLAEHWKCLACGAASFAVSTDPFHAFCCECHAAVSSRGAPGPKGQALLGKLWMLADEALKERSASAGKAGSNFAPTGRTAQ